MAPEGTYDAGRIADLGAAQEMALAEKPGRDAAEAIGDELQKQAETDLDEEQRKNLEIMEGVKKLYPDAFMETVDKNGKKVMFVEPRLPGETGSAFLNVLTMDGIFNVTMSPVGGTENKNVIDWDEFTKFTKANYANVNTGLSVPINEKVVPDKKTREESSQNYLSATRWNLSNDTGIDNFKNALTEAQARGEAKKKLDVENNEKRSVSYLLDKLAVR